MKCWHICLKHNFFCLYSLHLLMTVMKVKRERINLSLRILIRDDVYIMLNYKAFNSQTVTWDIFEVSSSKSKRENHVMSCKFSSKCSSNFDKISKNSAKKCNWIWVSVWYCYKKNRSWTHRDGNMALMSVSYINWRKVAISSTQQWYDVVVWHIFHLSSGANDLFAKCISIGFCYILLLSTHHIFHLIHM